MAWHTPKTNWKVQRDNTGMYIGDFFSCTDYNRIKNNMVYLHEQIPHPIDLGGDKTESDMPYASEFNAIEQALEYLRVHVIDLDVGAPTEFFQNGRAITADELNRIESAQQRYYQYFNG